MLRRRCVVALAVALSCRWPAGPAEAHRLDALLQATLISVGTDAVGVEITLTPGVRVADSVIATLDTDRDGAISSEEVEAYADTALASVRLSLDGRPLVLRRSGQEVSDLPELREGTGWVRISAHAPLDALSAGTHTFDFENRYSRSDSVYLANALVPTSAAVIINRQERNRRQTSLRVVYTLQRDAR